MVGLIAAGVTTIGVIVNPVTYGVPAPGGVSSRIVNPGGIEALGDAVAAVLVVSILTVIAVVGAAFVSLIVRYRYAGRDERQQIKWLAFVAALALVSQAVAFASLIACGCDNSPVANIAYIGTEVAAFIGIPAAITIAILRYRLYDIDLIINRALVYGLIATALTAIYVGVVVGVGALVGSSGSSTLTIVAAVAIALLFQPLRRRAQRLANRLVYGDRATPYQVLSDFAERMAGTYALDDVLERMASILAGGTGATRVDVWLRVGGELRPVAAWPADAPGLDPIALAAGDALPAFEMTRAVAVRHGAELFGALTPIKPRNEPLTPTEDKLVEDLASQAGLVLRNARLTEELESVDELRRRAAPRRGPGRGAPQDRAQHPRWRPATARRALGAARPTDRVGGRPAKAQAMPAELQGGLRDALDNLRDLARGIYPPLLADKGLAAALEAQARKAALPTTVEPDGVGRYPQEVEAAVYFCALEAMQNVAKYADARSTTVRLAERNGRLIFEIEDDGRGLRRGRDNVRHGGAGDGGSPGRDRGDTRYPQRAGRRDPRARRGHRGSTRLSARSSIVRVRPVRSA